MDSHALLDALKTRFGDAVIHADVEALDPWFEILVDRFHEVCLALRDDPEWQMNYLHCISGVDYLEEGDESPRMEVWYHLSSMTKRHRLVLRVRLSRWKDGQPGQLPQVPTVSDIWRTAEWHEREVFDLSGVEFTDHPDPRRLLCPEDWEGHPLRKDYEPPEQYHGIRVK